MNNPGTNNAKRNPESVRDLDPAAYRSVGAMFKRFQTEKPDAHVDLARPYLSKDGNRACMTGWYLIERGLEPSRYYKAGAELLANDLGFHAVGDVPARVFLKDFFYKNVDLWGNTHANAMFLNRCAYGIPYYKKLTFGIIGDFFIAASARIAQAQGGPHA